MQLIASIIAGYILIAAIGMAMANKKVAPKIAQQRWLKFGTYLLITATVLISILLNHFFIVGFIITGFGYYELVCTISVHKQAAYIALLFFTIFSSGFLFFAFSAPYPFQFFLYFQVLTFDAFGQITGQLIGKTPMAPRISPAKTWEGFLGGTLFCVLTAMVTADWLGINSLLATLLGLFTSVTSLIGDLLASSYKRITGIKDYSNLLKGQGGFLDRFDSFIMTGFWYAIVYIVTGNWVGSFLK